MRATTVYIVIFYLIAHLVNGAPKPDPEKAASRQITQWQHHYNDVIRARIKNRTKGCTLDEIVKRQEWGSLSKKSRTEYIKAVQCLQKKKPKYPKKIVPGSRSRYDDFVALHVIQAGNIHYSGIFFHWHRYYIWLYEKALRDECGYSGYLPYWDWTLSWEDPRKSTVFDGSPYSMGSNGKTIPHNATHISAFGLSFDLPPATGGGCVYSGPFQPKDYTVTLGPVASEPKGGDGGLAYNPRCLTRDLGPEWTNNTRPTDVVRLINSCKDLGCLDTNVESNTGVHTSGHFAMGGTGIDAYSSPGDPAFYLHHAQIDRVWSIWQSFDTKKRESQLYGTSSAFNNPPTPNVTENTMLDYSILANQQKISDLGSAVDGPFCYMYV